MVTNYLYDLLQILLSASQYSPDVTPAQVANEPHLQIPSVHVSPKLQKTPAQRSMMVTDEALT